jgi:hypothetical protein
MTFPNEGTGVAPHNDKDTPVQVSSQVQSDLEVPAPRSAKTSVVAHLAAAVRAIFRWMRAITGRSRHQEGDLVWRRYDHLIDEGYWIAGPTSAEHTEEHTDDSDNPKRS